MKTYPIPEGATYVLVTDGPVSFITPALESQPLVGALANVNGHSLHEEENKIERLPEGSGEHDESTRKRIQTIFDRTNVHMATSLVFRRSVFRAWREGIGMSQDHVAQKSRSYVSGTSVGNIENGRTRPNKNFVLWAAREMEVDPTDLLDLYERVM